MCGIAGIFHADSNAEIPRKALERMVDALAHRGPDDHGLYIAGGVGLGMRRLSIIDVAGGHQPMSAPDGRAHVVYNGECYNHVDLRRDLESRGRVFRTRCDTEVILHGYLAWGMAGLCERLEGIYGFCIWDQRRQKAYLCRDRLGVKPLHYVDRNGRFAFSSELRSVVQSGLVRAKIDETALWGYLAYQFTPTEQTLVSGVKKIPPGHFLEWDQGKVSIHRYWDFPNEPEDSAAQLAERTEALRSLLWDTVDRQMMSDVPIGCFLSGGLDSTIIAFMMAKLSNHPIRTFSISFPGNSDCDESEFFEPIARQLGARHQTVEFSERLIIDTLDSFAWAMDEPVADPAMLPTFLLSQAAAKEVKVVLTGEGADEVFAGYPYYRPFVGNGDATSRGEAARSRPVDEPTRMQGWLSFSKAMSDPLGSYIPGPRNDLVSPISNFPYALDPRFIWNLLHLDRRPAPERLDEFNARIEHRAVAGLTESSSLQAALALDTKLWLANNLMPKLDKMTMAHSLEGRVPFLDHRLVEFAFTLPGSFKVGPKHGKLILREAVKGIIPEHMVSRVKHGFNVPLYQWFRGPLQSFARDAVLGPTLRDTGLFHRKALEALLVAHLDLDVNVARPLWELICLSRWFERLKEEIPCQETPPPPTVIENTAGPRPETRAESERGSRGDQELPPMHSAGPPGVCCPNDTIHNLCDVVVPVYEGLNYVRDLIRSLRRHTHYPYRVVLLDDSANDATFQALRLMTEGDARIELHRNEKNVGFVETCNRGLALCRAEFICVMNTDVIVTDGWLTKMVRCARSDDRIAIVNPLSNMCVNLSVPMPPGLNLNTMALEVSRRSRERYPDITTAVGFCMLVKRQHLDWLGGFDEVYGRGYCEESDMCLRYTEAGLRVVAADDAFVYHKGCGSFGTWLERYEANRKIFDERWEEAYLRDYRNFLRRNPLQYIRDALLRHTIPKADWTPATGFAFDRITSSLRRWNPDASHRLRRSSRCIPSQPSGLPAADVVAPVLSHTSTTQAPRSDLEGKRPTSESLPATRTAMDGFPKAVRRAMARPRTELDPTQRRVRYPTRSYIERLPETDGLRVTFLIAREMPVCGGIISVVQVARELLLAGHDVKLVTLCEQLEPERFNLPCQPLVYPNEEELVRLFPPSDVVVATFWTTAHEYLTPLRRRYDFVSAYFVQDYEAYFYPESELRTRQRVRASYAMADHRIVKSRWLKELIERADGVPCEQIHLGLDLDIFRRRTASDDLGSPPRVVAVARPDNPRRGFTQVVEVFRRVHAARPDVEFVFFGTPDASMPSDLPFPYVNAGRLDELNKVAELIGSCDVLVDPSLFQGFGRPGLEAMACGTACVLTSEGGVNEYARRDRNCLMVRPQDNPAMADAILLLLSEEALRLRLRDAGLATAAEYCHRDEARLHLEHYRRWLREKYGVERSPMVAQSVDSVSTHHCEYEVVP